ncbi:hypothetical protein MRB53_036154 [Persea americana]|uniref:Uncharacterized protein n=1 Tax=Persea americana TaxID=3435 RepID=A0ACC2K6Q7_PERAE|nr:hypothetical protein MRB53_036154 [Persea americana]
MGISVKSYFDSQTTRPHPKSLSFPFTTFRCNSIPLQIPNLSFLSPRQLSAALLSFHNQCKGPNKGKSET